MIRINNASPIIILLILLIVIILTKFTRLTIVLLIVGLLLLLCYHFKIIHSTQIMNYIEQFIDFFMSNDNPLEIGKKIEEFKDSLSDDSRKDKDIPKDVLYEKVPILAEYETLQKDILQFIKNIKKTSNEDILSKDSLILNINKHVAYIYYYAYATMIDNYYPQYNYTSCLEHQKKLLNTIHSFIYLDVSPLYDVHMNELLEKTEKINKKLNTYIIENINTKFEINDSNENLYYYTGQLHDINSPEPYNNVNELQDFF